MRENETVRYTETERERAKKLRVGVREIEEQKRG